MWAKMDTLAYGVFYRNIPVNWQGARDKSFYLSLMLLALGVDLEKSKSKSPLISDTLKQWAKILTHLPNGPALMASLQLLPA